MGVDLLFVPQQAMAKDKKGVLSVNSQALGKHHKGISSPQVLDWVEGTIGEEGSVLAVPIVWQK
jgi:hypothetical protein